MAQPMEVDESIPFEYDSDEEYGVEDDIEKFLQRPEDEPMEDVDQMLHDQLQEGIFDEGTEPADENLAPPHCPGSWCGTNVIPDLRLSESRDLLENDTITKSAPESVVEKPFKLCMVRTSDCKALIRSIDQLTYKTFTKTIREYMYQPLTASWAFKVFVNEHDFKHNKFTMLAKTQSNVVSEKVFRDNVAPKIKSGQFCFITNYNSSIALYRGKVLDTPAVPGYGIDDGKLLAFQGPEGTEKDAKDFANLIWVITGIDPQKDPKGVVLGTGHYRPELKNTYLLWNASMNHEQWRRDIFLQLDRRAVFIFFPRELPEFEIHTRSVEDALSDIKDSLKVSIREPGLALLPGYPPSDVKGTLDPYEKKKGSELLLRARNWDEARQLVQRKKKVVAFKRMQHEILYGRPPKDANSPVDIYERPRQRLSGLRQDLQNVEDSKNRFMAEQQNINDEWKRRQAASFQPERVYGPDGKTSVPKYGNTVEEAISGGKFMPTTYARVLTAAEVEELRRRLVTLENELLQREKACRVCDQTFDFESDETNAHYAEHKAALSLSRKSATLSTPPRETESQTSRTAYDPITMNQASIYDFGIPKHEGRSFFTPEKGYSQASFRATVESEDQPQSSEAVPHFPSADRIGPRAWTPSPPSTLPKFGTGPHAHFSPSPPGRPLSPIPLIELSDGRVTPESPDLITATKPPKRSLPSSSEDKSYDPDESSTYTYSDLESSGSSSETPRMKKVKIIHEGRSGLPTPGIDEPAPGETSGEPTIKKTKGKRQAKPVIGEKDDGVYRPNKEDSREGDEEESLPGTDGAEAKKKKYCPACWKCMHSFGAKKLKAHLKACGVGVDGVVFETKKEAELKKEGLELVKETDKKTRKGKEKKQDA